MTTCDECRNAIEPTDEFCPHCGTLRVEGVQCRNHAGMTAAGVCIICAEPYCGSCGGRVRGHFLCQAHSSYEIVEGMARVFGASDAVQVEYAKTCLAGAGLHPFVYARKAGPISLGGPEYTLFRASGESDGHIVNEFKLMVPCQEVHDAEQVLEHLGLRTKTDE
jgi:hypothetical protein